VQEGAVKVDGIDIKQVDPEALRNRMAVLFQDYASYELTVRENVMMGRPNGTLNDDQVIKALQDARSEWLLKKMPKGLDSKVGRLFESGHESFRWRMATSRSCTYHVPRCGYLDTR
jgi:ATP-binding cassette subfamily B protein